MVIIRCKLRFINIFLKIKFIIQGSADVFKFLVDHGANIKAKDDAGDTPLHNAAESNYFHFIQM